MTKQQFEAIFERLTPRRREVLLKFLANESDEAIANSLYIAKATVRKHIEEICKAFGLTNYFPDERRSKRQDLVALFAKYKPELLGGCTSVVENEGAIANPNAPASQANESDLDALVEKVRSHFHYCDKIQEQCGRLRILDVEWLVGIDNIYIDVNVLEKLPSNRRLELSDFQRFNPTIDNFDRLGLGKVREPQVPGLEAVTRYSKLMVLGKPGSGKTTFLKFLAIQCIRGEFQKERIPIFIELKVFAKEAKRKGEFSLLNYISQEVCICNVSAQQVKLLLHQGKFLILLDGLDEVQVDAGNEIMTGICDFSRNYFKNHFVITCRIAAQLANQRDSFKFTDVEVADFNSGQIAAFAKKWFVTVARSSRKDGEAKAIQFLEKLYLPENEQIRELAVTPILLNLTCLFFQAKAEFPSKRSKLYEQGLEIMLKRWDESRCIRRDEVYRNLSLPHKIKLLSQVAAITFEQGEYFFEQSKVEQLITNYIRTLPDATTDPEQLQIDSEAVLKSIEAQHGLLVERAREIYSFSHLAFQEYFTSKDIVTSSQPQTLKNLVINSTNDESGQERWHEVFLLVAEMFDKSTVADQNLQLMKSQIDEIITQDDDLQYLQYLLAQASQKSSTVTTSYKPAAIRAFYFSCGILLTNFIAGRQYFLGSFWFSINDGIELACAIDSNFFRTIESVRSLGSVLDINLSLDLGLICAFEAASQLSYWCGHGLPDSSEALLLYELTFKLDRQLVSILKIYVGVNHKYKFLMTSLQQLKNQLLTNTDEDIEKLVKWWAWDGEVWLNKLRDLIIEHRNMGQKQCFGCHEDFELLRQYCNTSKLLLKCLNSGCKVTPGVREEIEKTLLLPKAEIKRWKADNNRTSGR